MNWLQPKVYAVKHKDEEIRAASRSGGIFTALSDLVLDDGGIVYGCVLTEDFTAVHIRAENVAERNRMRGSKYIQSKLGDTFKNVQKDLDTGRSVLFSGTSCQVAGLKQFLREEYNNLFSCRYRMSRCTKYCCVEKLLTLAGAEESWQGGKGGFQKQKGFWVA